MWVEGWREDSHNIRTQLRCVWDTRISSRRLYSSRWMLDWRSVVSWLIRLIGVSSGVGGWVSRSRLLLLSTCTWGYLCAACENGYFVIQIRCRLFAASSLINLFSSLVVYVLHFFVFFIYSIDVDGDETRRVFAFQAMSSQSNIPSSSSCRQWVYNIQCPITTTTTTHPPLLYIINCRCCRLLLLTIYNKVPNHCFSRAAASKNKSGFAVHWISTLIISLHSLFCC